MNHPGSGEPDATTPYLSARERLRWGNSGSVPITPHRGDHRVARIGARYGRDCAPDGRDGGLVRGCRGRLRFVHHPRPGRAGEPRASRAPRSSWRSGVALPHSRARGDRAPTPRARYPIPLRWVGARLRLQRPAPMARASCFSTPVSGCELSVRDRALGWPVSRRRALRCAAP